MAYKKLNKKKVADMETGEVINKGTALDIMQDELEGAVFRINQEREALGETTFYQVKKRYSRLYVVREVIINEGGYTKMYNKKFEYLIENKALSKNARCFLFTVQPYIEYIESTVVYAGFNPTYDKLMEIMDMSKPTLMNTIAELEKLEIIKKKSLNGNIVIYINPHLLTSGKIVKKEVFDLFDSSRWNY